MKDTIIDWAQNSGVDIVISLLVAWLIYLFGSKLVEKVVSGFVRNDNYSSNSDAKQREKTLSNIFSMLLKTTVFIFAGISILSSIGFDIAPILAGAGILGLAIGFGAQELVRNFIAGVFILLEDQYRIGDVVTLADKFGTVESISLRTTVVRDLDGNVHYIPNGEIKIATNMTYEYSNINLDFGVGYSTDIDKLESVINKLGDDIATDEKWKDIFLTPPRFVRVNDFKESEVNVKVTAQVTKNEQWDAEGELRRRILRTFRDESIEIPFPQVVVHHDDSK